MPLLLEGQALGTIWIVSHDHEHQFDREDVRIMTSLADFTAAALQSSRARQVAEESQQALLTNMPGMVYRYLPYVNRFTFVNLGCRDLFEVEPEAALQNADILWHLIHPDDRTSFEVSVATAVENSLAWDCKAELLHRVVSSSRFKGERLRSEPQTEMLGMVYSLMLPKRSVTKLFASRQRRHCKLSGRRNPMF